MDAHLYKLVGGFKHLDYFPFHIWDVILPIDFHSIIFQDGYCTTKQAILTVKKRITFGTHSPVHQPFPNRDEFMN